MYERPHQSAYCDALGTAHSELEEISETLKQLETRRGLLEKVIEALSPCVNTADAAVERGKQPMSASVESVVPAATQEQTSLHEVQESLPSTFAQGSHSPKDAMQRRIDYALGLAVA
jgi:ABC-type transporter Mla subunit MlaD